MLYDFHQYQNGIEAGSIYATYLLCGRKSKPHPQQDGDVEMASSNPEQEPLSEDVPTTTISIVTQEDLESQHADHSTQYLAS